MRDDYYRDQCFNPKHYDRMIDLLMILNPACKNEGWATNAIHNCIRSALYDPDVPFATGMCMAIASKTTDGTKYKVNLYLDPLQDMPGLHREDGINIICSVRALIFGEVKC
jgi:hypothetical protein